MNNMTQHMASLSVKQYSKTTKKVASNEFRAQANHQYCTQDGRAATTSAGHADLNRKDIRAMNAREQKQTSITRILDQRIVTTDYFLVNVRAESKRKRITLKEDDDDSSVSRIHDHYEDESSYTLSPAAWLLRLGLRFGLRMKLISSTTQGWKSILETIRSVPDDALIFRYCRIGNISAIQELFACSDASIRDVDSGGYPPLHVSCFVEAQTSSYKRVIRALR